MQITKIYNVIAIDITNSNIWKMFFAKNLDEIGRKCFLREFKAFNRSLTSLTDLIGFFHRQIFHLLRIAKLRYMCTVVFLRTK